MDLDLLIDDPERVLTWLENSLIGLVQPWRLYQLAIIVTLFLAAHLLANRLSPRLDTWMRGLEGVPKARLRLLVLVAQRLRALTFIALTWGTVAVMRGVTWPSRSYLLSLVASLATAWVFVSITSRLIQNRLLRTVATWTAWGIVTVYILGLATETSDVLDRVAIEFGEVRLSLLLIIKAAITLAILFALARWLSAVTTRRLDALDDISPSMKVLTEKLLRFSIYAAAIIIGLRAIGFDLTNVAVLSGAIGLGLGFGLQKVVSNLVSGVILLLDKSIKPGDVISLGETSAADGRR